MNELQELLQNINPSFVGRYGRSSLSSVLAKAEQVIFDKLLKSREISDIEGARTILAQLHSGDTPTSLNNFDAYVGQLHSLKKPDKFAVDLAELMSEVNNSENPQAVLEGLVRHGLFLLELLKPSSNTFGCSDNFFGRHYKN